MTRRKNYVSIILIFFFLLSKNIVTLFKVYCHIEKDIFSLSFPKSFLLNSNTPGSEKVTNCIFAHPCYVGTNTSSPRIFESAMSQGYVYTMGEGGWIPERHLIGR
jgi:hypothetical protein